MLATRCRIRTCIFFLSVSAIGASAGTNYHALIIRSLEPLDTLLVEKFKVNDKDKFHRLTRDGPLTKDQYKRLPRLSFGDVHFFRVANGRLQVHIDNETEFPALPGNFKDWPVGALNPAIIIRGSNLNGHLLDLKRSFKASLVEGWVIYLFPQRPGEDTVAFSLAELQNREEAWASFLRRFPSSVHAHAARESLASAYLERATRALSRFQEALREKKPGYVHLGEARKLFNRLRSLNIQTPALTEARATLDQLETDIADRLHQARLTAENADFAGAQEILEPLQHFRDEFPELAAELEAIQQMAAHHHLAQARQRLSKAQFDEAVRELAIAASYEQLAEIHGLRAEVKERRLAHQRQQEIQQVSARARAAASQNDFASALDALWALATRYPKETKLQNQFSSLRRLYRPILLDEVPEAEKLHTPIRGRSDEDMLLKLHRDLTRLATFESSPELAVWRDRLSMHLADYYRQRATETAKRSGATLNALAFAYLQQAHHLMLDKSELAEFTAWRERLEDQLRVRVALNFRDLTPAANGQYLVAELSAQIASALQNAGYPHVEIVETSRGGPVRHSLALIVELLHAGVREDAQTEPIRSAYSAGFRQIPNPRWRVAKTDYDQAVETYEQVRTRVEQNRRRKKHNKKDRQADDEELVRAQAALKQAKEAMDTIPAFTEEEDVRPYEFARRTLVRTAEIRLAYRWVNALTGVREAQDILEAKDSDQAIEVAGVHPADTHDSRNQPASLADGHILRGRALRKIQQQLSDRALKHLASFIEREFERAQQEAERAQPEIAAEHYLRFLFNSSPDDPRRHQAFQYLRSEFRFVALGEWLAVSGERH